MQVAANLIQINESLAEQINSSKVKQKDKAPRKNVQLPREGFGQETVGHVVLDRTDFVVFSILFGIYFCLNCRKESTTLFLV